MRASARFYGAGVPGLNQDFSRALITHRRNGSTIPYCLHKDDESKMTFEVRMMAVRYPTSESLP